MLTVRYFAWARERLNRAEEQVSPPDHVRNVGELIGWLMAREEVAGLGLAPGLLRSAVDARLATPETPIAGARVVAIFPPMTGG